jgi:hypothetical protein
MIKDRRKDPHMVRPGPEIVCVTRTSDVLFWTIEFGTDEQTLKDAVERVGPTPAAIRCFLDVRQSGF